ncbi:hypothetical protein PQJ75_09155 [Rhodoplanes sp. TEM]|uniref:Uncharacterized protein n=1 Tax=Rhodoplanes tepidamans TaxID=200616 RepID=A0ABT5JCV1_RHOTP|nr:MULTISPECIES: hypothetical protein [Rhodoplanes]MDC7787513.1 hypothetical protein [Rhodoplanes tepidamans]MDC7983896.1 hypothetical protein [Rhodoplanes sp. TEM]MDQ0354334.1 hypothetical protein [Rhodoplanes tepidamans]
MAAPTIRNASGRPLRRSPAWNGRGPERRPVPVRRPGPSSGPAPLWRIVAGPLSFLAVALIVAGVMTAWMSSRTPTPPAAPPAARTEPELSAAEAVRLRFAPELLAVRPAELPSSDFAERFGPGPQRAAPGDQVSAYAPLATAPAVPEPGRARPSNALLNDAQIASIKTRLKLTAEQEKLWVPVETALRGVVWRRGADRRGSGPAALDAQSVERLKAAAAPLMGRLRDDQKREIRSLSHVMGLGDLAEKL